MVCVENTDSTAIDDELVITIKNLIGDIVHKEKKQIYLEPGEAQFVRFYWIVPSDAAKGHYWLKAEFDAPYIDALPSVNSFWVN